MLFSILDASSKEYAFVNNFNNDILYSSAEKYFREYNNISVYREIRGLAIVFPIIDIRENFFYIEEEIKNYIRVIEYFLAKNKNPAIIEVHIDKNASNFNNLKKWEVSTVIANKIEELLLKQGNITQDKIKSVGYGEFFPQKNTSNNGVKYAGRAVIIILCK